MSKPSIIHSPLLRYVYAMYQYIDELEETTLESEQPSDIQLRHYISGMREEIDDYFASQRIDKKVLKDEMVMAIQELYLHSLEGISEDREEYVQIYYQEILGHLFRKIQELDIYIFFILENYLSDAQFLKVISVFQHSGFATIVPYEDKEVEDITELFSDKVTHLHGRDYSEIENDLAVAVAHRKNILYLEKDMSMSFLKRVLMLGHELPPQYLMIYRNKGPEINKMLVLKGRLEEVTL